MNKPFKIEDQVFNLHGEWLAILDGELVKASWNTKGAAQAGLQVERRRKVARLKPCKAVIHHGPGHQSRSECDKLGPHKQHSFRGEMFWSAKSYGKRKDKNGKKMCFSGYFDESPEAEGE